MSINHTTTPVAGNAEGQLSIYPSASTWTKWRNISPLSLRALYWLYDHPTTRKAAEVASYIIGAGFVVAACFSPALPAVVGLAAVGVLVMGITYAASKILNCMVPKPHDMQTHVFRPEKLEKNGKLLGELYYDNHLPILKIHSKDSYDAGYVQGYLLNEALSSLRSNVEFCLFTLAREKRPTKIQNILDAIKDKIPQRFILELQGLADGYNARKSYFDKAITLDDLLYLQLMPDKTYFKPGKIKAGNGIMDSQPLIQLQTAACTVIGLKDKDSAPLLARTMDWPSFGKAGTLSLIVSRINSATGVRTAEVTVPGLIGTLTGVNSSGLTTSMNVTKYENGITTIEGIPAALYNRMVLEECESFDQAETFISTYQPLGPYHLTVSDQVKAGTFSLYQQKDWSGNWSEDRNNGHLLRLLDTEKPLVTTNCSYNSNQTDMFNGKVRELLIQQYFQENSRIQEPRGVLENSQSIPWVNNHLTTHRVLLGSKTLEVAFDNAWAGDRALHSLNLAEIFSES